MEQTGSTSGAVPGPEADFSHPMGPGFGKILSNMRFVGWVGLVYGILTCLSIVGAILGVPLIIASHRFIEGLNRFENYRHDRSESELKAGFQELGRSFQILKVLTIIYIVLTVGYIATLFLVGGLGILGGILES